MFEANPPEVYTSLTPDRQGPVIPLLLLSICGVCQATTLNTHCIFAIAAGCSRATRRSSTQPLRLEVTYPSLLGKAKWQLQFGIRRFLFLLLLSI